MPGSQSRTAATFPPPVMEARRWLEGVDFSSRDLLNVSQAAPVAAPPQPMLKAMAESVLNDPGAHLYGPVLGLPELRDALSTNWSTHYAGTVTAQNIAITSGCNQAFAAVISALCSEGDEVLLPTPWYFNHKMWLDMSGVKAVPLPSGPGLLPDPEAARAALTSRTRAIALVTPNNPAGVEYPAELMAAFRDLAQNAGIKLIVDETYRDFDSRSGPPHALLSDPDWAETVISLYSFSKAYRLTGHRVGAVIGSQKLMPEIEKFLDTVAICPNQLGQRAALWGLENLSDWLAGERAEILARRAAIETGFSRVAAQGWELLGAGAYFSYMRHPFDMASDNLAPALVKEAQVLLLPGTMFRPQSDGKGAQELRVAFANIDASGITELYDRLSALAPSAFPS
ncbi:MAG: aminotransferase [Pseudomonadota bacterium]